MKTNISYIKKLLRNVAPVATVALLSLALTNCERRDLWVYADQFKQVLLNVDWRNYMRDSQLYPYTPDPQGMTVWFYPTDGRKSYQTTTSEVRHFETYLSAGDYKAVVIDYSPQEYGHQEFVGMDWANTAKVQATRHSYQPADEVQLFGPNSYQGTPALTKTEPSGLYTVSFDPEQMASDTVNMTISTGKYDDYIPYDEYEEYQRTLVRQEFDAEPLILPWRMRIRVYVRGIYYMYKVEGSVAGLADGYMLAEAHTSDDPCIQYLDQWESYVDGDNVGYIALTFNTWGLRNSMWPSPDYVASDYYPMWPDPGSQPQDTKTTGKPSDIRLNLKFTLRDRKTVMYYLYDIGDLVQIHHREYALRVDLWDGFEGEPNLPYVDAYNGLGFDGWVVPWEEGADAGVQF